MYPVRDKILEGWKKLHNEELYNLYSSPNLVRMITSRRMSRTGLVARMGNERSVCKFFVERET
jgi:hypothetical protein